MTSANRAQRRSQQARKALAIVGEGDHRVMLTVADRLVLRNLLPKEGNLLTMRAVVAFQETLEFTEEEEEEFGITREPGQISWNVERIEDTEREIVVTGRMYLLVGDKLRELDKAGKLEAQHVALYDKFVKAES